MHSLLFWIIFWNNVLPSSVNIEIKNVISSDVEINELLDNKSV